MPLAFKLPDDVADLSEALRGIEQQLPKQHRDLILQAATELAALKQLCHESAQELELAALMRAGQMDSQSRSDEIARQVRATMTGLAERLRAA